MKTSKKHIITRTIFIAMMVLMCLPCTVKQEIKQALDIPVSQLERFEKPGQQLICQSLTIDESRKAFHPTSVKDDIIADEETASFNPVPRPNSTRRPLSNSSVDLPFSVPIYLLHEQYLI